MIAVTMEHADRLIQLLGDEQRIELIYTPGFVTQEHAEQMLSALFYGFLLEIFGAEEQSHDV